MSWRNQVHHDPDYIETVYSGYLSGAQLNQVAQEVLGLCRRHGITRLLGDCSALDGGHSFMDLHFLADRLAHEPETAFLREAMVLPHSYAAAEHVRFWEMTASTHGVNVRTFASRAEAMAWLLQSDEQPRGVARAVASD